MARLIGLIVACLVFVAFSNSASAQTSGPGITRPITTGCSDLATSKDYSGTISWRSPTLCPKTETLPTCGPYNNGKWIQVVDAQNTAGTVSLVARPDGSHVLRAGGGRVARGSSTAGGASVNPITIGAGTSSVNGPILPVVINVDRAAFVLTCDGAAATWLVTASSP